MTNNTVALWTAGDWGLGDHLQFQKLGEQDGLVALGAATTKSDRAAEDVAFGAAPLADLTLATDAAFVDRVCNQRTPLAEFGAQPLLVDGNWLDVAQPKCTLLMGA